MQDEAGNALAPRSAFLRGHFRIAEMATDIRKHEGMYPFILK